jgi:ornithine cyclodeaminase
MIPYFLEADVARLMPLETIIPLVEAAFRDRANGVARDTPRQRTPMPQGTLHVLQAASEAIDRIGFKYYFPGKEARTFQVHVIELSTGRLLGIVEADELGIRRTGAATAVATNALARQDAAVVACFGSGRHAVTQLLSVSKVRKITEVRAFGRTPERLERFKATIRQELGLDIKIVESREAAIDGADIINIVTRSPDPLFDGRLIQPGQHINAVGSNALHRREIDGEVLRKANLIVVDSREVAKRECGDLLPALESGQINWDRLPELGDVLIGRHPGRKQASDITLFESQGMGLLDLYTASALLQSHTSELTV